MTTTMAAASMAATMSVWPAVVAVIGTLAGTLVANVVQAWTARTARRETRRNDAVTAVAALAAALADHRRAMWVLENRQLTGADQDAVAEAQAANHETRSALTAPLVLVKILTPSLAALAQTATQATFAMRGAADSEALEQLRAAARNACDDLVREAGRLFAALGAAVAVRGTAAPAFRAAVGGATEPRIGAR